MSVVRTLALLTFFAAAPAIADESYPKGTAVPVGISGMLSGPGSSYRSQPDGLKAYLDLLNKKGGINGYTFNITLLDNQSSAAGGAVTTRQLALLNPLFVSIQGTNPFSGSIPILKANADVPVLSFGGTQQIEDAGLTNVYGQQPSFPAVGLFNMQYLIKDLDQKNVAIVYQNDATGEEAGRIAPAFAKGLGASDVIAIPVTATDSNLGPVAARLKNAGVKGVNVIAYANILASLQKASAAIDYHPIWVTWPSNFSESYLSLAGNDAEGTYVSSFIEPYSSDSPAAKEFRDGIEKLDHSANNALGATGWIFGQIVEKAVQQATANGKPLTRSAFVNALNTAFDGKPVGMAYSVRYSPQDHVTMARELAVYRVTKGKFERVADPKMAPKVPK